MSSKKTVCKICGAEKTRIIYHGELKTGLLKGWTEKEYNVYQCDACKTIWNEAYQDIDVANYYESAEYRKRIETDISVEAYWEKYGKEVLDKLSMTGTGVFRNKIVADIGCGGGSFLDYIKGVAKETIAVEPSEIYRAALVKNGHATFPYASFAKTQYENSIDVITSFDVIEHVASPQDFLNEIFSLCKPGGGAVVGTPTDYPVLRQMLGKSFDRFIFQVQHPWVLSEEALRLMAERAGFQSVEIRYKQKYGLGNLLSWLLDETPRGDIKYGFISDTIDAAYRAEMGKKETCEYLVLYARK